MYHQLAPESVPGFEKYIVSPAAFARQVAWLRLLRYRPISLDAFLTATTSSASLPHRAVVITFDDGFQACIDHAVPVLDRHRFPATFFVVAGLVGGTSRWLLHERGIEFRLADWRAIAEVSAGGFAIGSHTMTHPRLAALSPEACRAQLIDSKHVLEDRLGQDVQHLAYPFGSFDSRVLRIAGEAGYRSACSVEIGLADRSDDSLALRRVPINGNESLLDFVSRLLTAQSARVLVQRAVERARLVARRPAAEARS